MKNYKPKSEVIIKEIIRKISTPNVPNVETPVIDDMMSFWRSRSTPTQRIVLQQKSSTWNSSCEFTSSTASTTYL